MAVGLVFHGLLRGICPGGTPWLGNLDNLYRLQRDDGYLSMAYEIRSGRPAYGERINPPLFGWVEWAYAVRTGDDSRLERVYPILVRFDGWLKAHRRRPNGLYYFEDTGSSGMDNSPRCGFPAHDLQGGDLCFVDLACQQVLAARSLAHIARHLGKADEAASHDREAEALSRLINELHWCEKTAFYHDLFCKFNNKLANETIAAFWAIVSGVAKGERLEKLVLHLTNPETFGGAYHPVPTLSRDDPNFQSSGGYWLGSVWAPTNYMIVRGLRENGYRALAREIAERHLVVMSEVAARTDSIRECYSPDSPMAATIHDLTSRCAPDFVGWSGLGPIVMLVEDLLGLDLDGLGNAAVWHLHEKGRQGVEDLPFAGGSLSMIANVEEDDSVSVEITSDRPVHGRIVCPDGIRSIAFDLPAGRHHLLSE